MLIVVRGPYTQIPAAHNSLPLMYVNLSPFQIPNIVPTAKLLSIMLEPSSGSKATEYSDPSPKSKLEVSSEEIVATLSFANRLLIRISLAKTSMANCSSPKSLKQANLLQEAV